MAVSADRDLVNGASSSVSNAFPGARRRDRRLVQKMTF